MPQVDALLEHEAHQLDRRSEELALLVTSTLSLGDLYDQMCAVVTDYCEAWDRDCPVIRWGQAMACLRC